jgi:dynein assembly factor 2
MNEVIEEDYVVDERSTMATSTSLGERAAAMLMGEDASGASSSSGAEMGAAVESVPDDKLEQLFKLALDEGAEKSGKDALDLSEDEVKKFSSAFKKPEFREMFKEYLAEISNPDNRAEYEEYIKSQEVQNQAPVGRELMKPNAGFALKTRDESGNKVFINVCHHEKVGKPTQVKEHDGTRWQLPYSLGPCRSERDNKGELAPTYDICFHTKTVEGCEVSPAMKQMVIGMALESVERALNQHSHNGASLSRDCHVLRNVTCVGGTPAIQTIASADAPPRPTAAAAAGSSSSAGGSAVAPATPAAVARPPQKSTLKGGFLNKGKKSTKKGKKAAAAKKAAASAPIGEGRSGGVHAARTTSLASRADAPSSKKGGSSPSAASSPAGPRKPAYKLTEQSNVEMGDFGLASDGSAARARGVAKRPKALLLRVTLPELKSAAGVDLDVAERVVKLRARQKQSKKHKAGGAPNPTLYELEVALSYAVLTAKAGAKWDRATHVLTVTMPVAKPLVDGAASASMPPPLSAAAAAGGSPTARAAPGGGLVSEIGGTDVDAGEAATASSLPSAGQRAMEARRAKRAATRHQAWVENGEAESKSAEEEAAAAAAAGEGDAEAAESLAESIRRQVAEVEAKKKEALAAADAAALERATADAAAAAAAKESAADAEGRAPPYRWQQNGSTVAVLVEVPKITAASVDVSFSKRAVELSFSCDAPSEEGAAMGPARRYTLTLALHAPIDTKRSRFDVADLNLALVLYKDAIGAEWPALLRAGDGDAEDTSEVEAEGAEGAESAEPVEELRSDVSGAADDGALFANATADFVASPHWRGVKRVGGKRSVYMNGAQGLGYYVDAYAIAADVAAAAAVARAGVVADTEADESVATAVNPATAAAAAVIAPVQPRSSAMMKSTLMFELD